MSVNPVTTLGTQALLISTLQQQDSQLTHLTSELSSQQLYSNLTDYDPSDARNIISIQSSATQAQSYISAMNSVSTQLSMYDTTMTDMESIVSQAQSLADDNPNYSTTTATNLGVEATNYLASVGADLNQQINGQYIYSGTRFNTAPVANLSNLPTSTLSAAVYTDGSSLPSYDSSYTASTLTEATSGQDVTIGGTVSTGQSASITINGTTYSYVATASDTTTDDVAAGLEAVVAGAIPGTTVSGSTITVGPSGTINSANPTTSSAAAYTTGQATIATNYTVNYGVSSDNPAFQQIVSGLRYLQKAGNDTDPATYQADIKQAASLLTSGLNSLQTLHTSVAYNINLMTNETATQKTAISNLTDQLDNIQQVDVTQVSAQITAMETILQASYMVTGDIEKMSIVSYL